MSIYAETTDPLGRPVLVKRGRTAGERSRLGHEADILSLAVHPGVVELLDFSDDGEAHLTIARVQARTATTLGVLPIEEAAGLIADLAHTLSDLHDLGIVHGRVEADHVLVTDDGRTVLCGWSAATATALPVGHPDAPTSHHEPAVDVAGLGRVLTDLVGPTQPSPIPDRRRRWKADPDCRSALLTLADAASHDDPARRPSAAAFATDVRTLVPDARPPRPPSPDLDPGPAGSPAPGEGAAPESSLASSLQWPGAAEPDPFTALLDQHGLVPPDPAFDRPIDTASGSPFDGTPTLRRQALGALAVARPSPDRRRSPARKATILIAAVLAIAAGALSFSRSSGAGGPAPTTFATPTTQATPTAPPRSSPPVAPAATTRPTTCGVVGGPDVDGDGCGDQVSVADGVVTTPDHRYVVGGRGDEVLVADWDCDGRATPALLRVASGEVFLFPGWAEQDRSVTVSALATARPGSRLTADDADHDGCASLTLHEPGQPARVLDAGRRP